MNKIYSFQTVSKILFGIGARKNLGDEAAKLGARPFVVVSRTLFERGDLTDDLRHRCKQVEIAVGPSGEPDIVYVEDIRSQCRKVGCDVAVGIGGGSVLDAAKAVAALAHEPRSIEEVFYGASVSQRGIPFVAVPTTAGTGTEVTPNSVLHDSKKRIKQSIRGGNMLARLVVNDPELTLDVPRQVKIWSGADALTQAIESFTSLGANELTDALAFRAFTLIARRMAEVAGGSTEIEPHVDMAYGSMLAGMAFANARLGAVHGLAHPLGVRYHIPHGLCCAILLPAVMRFNEFVVAEKYAQLSAVVSEPIIPWISNLFRNIGIPATFAEYTIPQEDIEPIVQESLPSGSLKANPRPVSGEDLVGILGEILE
ncbi:MAG: iron-containing alcohol dehydrogenase [bacterium]